jgi:GT2 family glycosyltransferase
MLSVIIPTCNRNELLAKCLDRLDASVQCVDKQSYEVIVSDDSSENVSKEFIESKYPWVKWIGGPKKGPAANRNNGAAYAKGEWLIFLDDDCLPGFSLLSEYEKAIAAGSGIEVFEGYVGADRAKKSFVEEAPINETGGYLWSCNFMISKKLFNDLEGFDIVFPFAAMEDVDLRYRLKKLDKKIIFLAAATVIHPWRKNKKIISNAKKRFLSTLYFLRKHPEMNKTINGFYFLKISSNLIKDALFNCFKYRFRGLGKQLQHSFIHLCFALTLPFYNLNK